LKRRTCVPSASRWAFFAPVGPGSDDIQAPSSLAYKARPERKEQVGHSRRTTETAGSAASARLAACPDHAARVEWRRACRQVATGGSGRDGRLRSRRAAQVATGGSGRDGRVSSAGLGQASRGRSQLVVLAIVDGDVDDDGPEAAKASRSTGRISGACHPKPLQSNERARATRSGCRTAAHDVTEPAALMHLVRRSCRRPDQDDQRMPERPAVSSSATFMRNRRRRRWRPLALPFT